MTAIKIKIQDGDSESFKVDNRKEKIKNKKTPIKKRKVSVKKPAIKKEITPIKNNVPIKAREDVEEKNAIDDFMFSKTEAVEKEIESALIKDEFNKKENIYTDSNQKEKSIKNIDEIKIPEQSVKIYKKIAFSFIFLTMILLIIILYVSFVKVSIVLIPNQETINNNMIFDVYDKDKNNTENANSITGIIKTLDVEYEGIYESSGEEIVGKDASGMAVIVNNYNKSQPLVATTRLLAPNGELFRIRNTINIPAGGSVEVEIYADSPNRDMELNPTRFTIPGLWAGLQDKIYAETKEKIVYKKKIKKYITELDIENCIRDLKQKLLIKARLEANSLYSNYDQILYKIDKNSIVNKVNGKENDEKNEFTGIINGTVSIVAFENNKASTLAKQKFVSSLPRHKTLLNFNNDDIIYSLNNYDSIRKIATVNSSFVGKISLKQDSKIVEPNKILGLNKKELDAYLSSIPEIAGFEVKFTPFFLPDFMKKVPKLTDKINIEIKN